MSRDAVPCRFRRPQRLVGNWVQHFARICGHSPGKVSLGQQQPETHHTQPRSEEVERHRASEGSKTVRTPASADTLGSAGPNHRNLRGVTRTNCPALVLRLFSLLASFFLSLSFWGAGGVFYFFCKIKALHLRVTQGPSTFVCYRAVTLDEDVKHHALKILNGSEIARRLFFQVPSSHW